MEIIIPCYPPPQYLHPQHTNAVSLGARVLVLLLRQCMFLTFVWKVYKKFREGGGGGVGACSHEKPEKVFILGFSEMAGTDI